MHAKRIQRDLSSHRSRRQIGQCSLRIKRLLPAPWTCPQTSRSSSKRWLRARTKSKNGTKNCGVGTAPSTIIVNSLTIGWKAQWESSWRRSNCSRKVCIPSVTSWLTFKLRSCQLCLIRKQLTLQRLRKSCSEILWTVTCRSTTINTPCLPIGSMGCICRLEIDCSFFVQKLRRTGTCGCRASDISWQVLSPCNQLWKTTAKSWSKRWK